MLNAGLEITKTAASERQIVMVNLETGRQQIRKLWDDASGSCVGFKGYVGLLRLHIGQQASL